MINCQEARNAITILEVECPQCGDSVEVFVKDGVVCTDSVCCRTIIHLGQANKKV